MTKNNGVSFTETKKKSKPTVVNFDTKEFLAFIDKLESQHRKELREAIEEAYKMGNLSGTMHHWGMTAMRSRGYKEVPELFEKYNCE